LVGFAAVALACVVPDSDRAAADGSVLEFLDYSFGGFCAGEVDETVRRISAGEGIDWNV
jgi:hypothetical protein